MKWTRPLVALTAGALLATSVACSSSGGGTTDTGSNPPGDTGSAAPSGSGSSAAAGMPDPSKQPASKIKAVTMTGDCADYGVYGKYPAGTKVSIYTSITDPELPLHVDAAKQFEKCTGITVQYTGDKDFETAIKTKVEGGNAPDLGIFPQPGLLQSFALSGDLKLASQAVTTEAEQNWVSSWIGYGSVKNFFFAAPLGANVKSLIWYSPKSFEKYGYTVPTTWDDMIKLSDQMVADGHFKPWCLGIESGEATGWVLTDWMEEVMLRMWGPDVYDQWVNHEIPFNDPKVQAVLDEVGKIVKNPKYVNAGIGDVKSIATTSFQSGGLPVAKGKCGMHAQANFYAANWNPGTKVAENGDVYAFYEPTMSDKFGKPVEGGGEFVGAFSDRPEVEAVQLFLASAKWATIKAQENADTGTSGWATANQNVDKSVIKDPVDKLSVDILTDANSTFRFDGSDSMPSSVGTGSFWKEMTQWILGESTKSALDKIEASWPK